MDTNVDSRLAANRFVTGALRRIRIRTKVQDLMWIEAGRVYRHPGPHDSEEMRARLAELAPRPPMLLPR